MVYDYQRLFVDTLSDLEKLSKSNDPYDLIRSSALIRQLFLDGNALVNCVNSNHKLKLSFEISRFSPPALITGPGIEDIWFKLDGLLPTNSAFPFSTVSLTQRDFFRTVIGRHNEERFSVKDIVKFIAHVSGGIHNGAPSDQKERFIHKVNCEYSVFGNGIALRSISSIGQVAVKSLDELKKKVLLK